MPIATTKTVGEIAVEVPNATREFEKLGIDYCCGGSRTLGEACADAKISVEETLARLQKSMAATPPQGQQDWQALPLADLIAHITSTHHVFVREECPRIETLAAKVVVSPREEPSGTPAGAADVLRTGRGAKCPPDEGGAGPLSLHLPDGGERSLGRACATRDVRAGCESGTDDDAGA